jgi:hypothetical protein
MTIGIQRTRITDPLSGRGKERFAWAEARHAAANRLYRLIFERLRMPLLPGEAEVTVTKEERQAQLDSALGIDVTLFLANGMSYMLQEKFLSRPFLTVTIEYENDPHRGLPGDWMHCQAACYFVGYDRTESKCFSEWILLDFPRVKQLTAQGRIPWSEPRANGRDGARATFCYVDFGKIPPECVMHGIWDRREHIGAETYSLDLWRTLEAQPPLFP